MTFEQTPWPLREPGWLTAFDFGANACEPVAVIELSEQTIIDQVADRLTSKYPTVPPHTLTAVARWPAIRRKATTIRVR